MKKIAVIPARGGSKRIPHKNIKMFIDKPIIVYSIEAALGSGEFDEVMVSTDDTRIAEVSRQVGASIPFLRSLENANDYATLADVLIEVLETYKRQGQTFEQVCCILPTAPMITAEDIRLSYAQWNSSVFDSICPVVAFSYPILRSLSLEADGTLSMNWPEYRNTRSQDLRPAYHDAGAFYWIKTSVLLKERTLFSRHGTGFVLDERKVQDIDTEADWAMAELKYKIMHGIWNCESKS